MSSPYQVTKDFEAALCAYTGAKYAVAVNSGTAALLLSVQWQIRDGRVVGEDGIVYKITVTNNVPVYAVVEIPRRTYVSVPCAILQAGARIAWRDEEWEGEYKLKPLPVWDSARRFTSGMYREGQFQCVSFAAAKILGAEQGGAILHDNAEADAWFRRMRFDGRTEGVDPLQDTFDLVGHHCIMIPSVAATLLVRLHHLHKYNADLPHYEYPDLSKHPAFS